MSIVLSNFHEPVPAPIPIDVLAVYGSNVIVPEPVKYPLNVKLFPSQVCPPLVATACAVMLFAPTRKEVKGVVLPTEPLKATDLLLCVKIERLYAPSTCELKATSALFEAVVSIVTSPFKIIFEGNVMPALVVMSLLRLIVPEEVLSAMVLPVVQLPV